MRRSCRLRLGWRKAHFWQLLDYRSFWDLRGRSACFEFKPPLLNFGTPVFLWIAWSPTKWLGSQSGRRGWNWYALSNGQEPSLSRGSTFCKLEISAPPSPTRFSTSRSYSSNIKRATLVFINEGLPFQLSNYLPPSSNFYLDLKLTMKLVCDHPGYFWA